MVRRSQIRMLHLKVDKVLAIPVEKCEMYQKAVVTTCSNPKLKHAKLQALALSRYAAFNLEIADFDSLTLQSDPSRRCEWPDDQKISSVRNRRNLKWLNDGGSISINHIIWVVYSFGKSMQQS